MDTSHTPLQSSPPSPVVLHLTSVGHMPFNAQKGNVKVELRHDGTHPLMILLPFTAEEASQQGDGWVTTWQLIRGWPEARALTADQWLLLWALCRSLHWFAQPNNGAQQAAWPAFMKAYLLLGELGRHFTFTRPIKDDLLLRFLLTWVRERIPEALMTPSLGFDLPEFVMQKALSMPTNGRQQGQK